MSRRRRRPSRTLPEELFGVVWARRFRVGIPAAAASMLVAGLVVFALWSQTLGQVPIALGLWVGVMWFALRRGDPDGALASLHRARPMLIAAGALLAAAGVALFVTVDQDAGLLLVLLGGAVLALTLVGVKQDPMASPLDGPMYGDTPPYGE